MDFDQESILGDISESEDSSEESISSEDVIKKENIVKEGESKPKKKKKSKNNTHSRISHLSDICLFTFAIIVHLFSRDFKKTIAFLYTILSILKHTIFISGDSTSCLTCNSIDPKIK